MCRSSRRLLSADVTANLIRGVMEGFVQLGNGFLMAEGGKIPPTAPEGYEAALDDPRVFLPRLPFCRMRWVNTKPCCGGKWTEEYYCMSTGKEVRVTRTRCTECGGVSASLKKFQTVQV